MASQTYAALLSFFNNKKSMQTYFGKPILIRFASCVFDWFTCLHREGQGIKRKRRLATTICMSNLKWGAASSIWRRKRSIPTVIQCPVFYIRQQMVLMQKYPHLNPEAEMITLSLVRIQTNCLYYSCSSFIYTVTFY